MRLFQRSFARTFSENLLLFSLAIALGLFDLLTGPLPSLAQDLSLSSPIVTWEYDQVNPAIVFNPTGNKYPGGLGRPPLGLGRRLGYLRTFPRWEWGLPRSGDCFILGGIPTPPESRSGLPGSYQ